MQHWLTWRRAIGLGASALRRAARPHPGRGSLAGADIIGRWPAAWGRYYSHDALDDVCGVSKEGSRRYDFFGKASDNLATRASVILVR